MKDVNPYFGVTVVVFAVYVLWAALSSRERDDAATPQTRALRRRLRRWIGDT